MTSRYALILGHNRAADLLETFDGIAPQVDMVVVHDNASDPPLSHAFVGQQKVDLHILLEPEQPPNLARFWNNSLDYIQAWHTGIPDPGPYRVAVLTDDLIIPAGWFDAVEEAMDRTGAAIGCSSGFDGRLTQEILKTAPDSDLANRLYGPAYIVNGFANLRCDERLKWWYNDTDMDWRGRAAGGMIMVPGPYVHNKYPNASTVGVNAEQAGRDRDSFKEIWGWVPW